MSQKMAEKIRVLLEEDICGFTIRNCLLSKAFCLLAYCGQ